MTRHLCALVWKRRILYVFIPYKTRKYKPGDRFNHEISNNAQTYLYNHGIGTQHYSFAYAEDLIEQVITKQKRALSLDIKKWIITEVFCTPQGFTIKDCNGVFADMLIQKGVPNDIANEKEWRYQVKSSRVYLKLRKYIFNSELPK